jgi:hypothetical protein
MAATQNFFTPLTSSNPLVQQANVDLAPLFDGSLTPNTPEFTAAFNKAIASGQARDAEPQAALTARYNTARMIQQQGAGSTDEGIQKLVHLVDHGMIPGGMAGVVSVETGKLLTQPEIDAHMSGPTKKY